MVSAWRRVVGAKRGKPLAESSALTSDDNLPRQEPPFSLHHRRGSSRASIGLGVCRVLFRQSDRLASLSCFRFCYLLPVWFPCQWVSRVSGLAWHSATNSLMGGGGCGRPLSQQSTNTKDWDKVWVPASQDNKRPSPIHNTECPFVTQPW